MDVQKIKEICKRLPEQIGKKHIGHINGSEKAVFQVGEAYPGVWLEHVFDAVLYASMFPESGKEIARNTVDFFITRQSSEGQLPCYVFKRERFPKLAEKDLIGYSQIQECVSFGSLCLETCEMLGDEAFLKKCFDAVKKWVAWQEENRMTQKSGLIEMFVGYDTGHDNSLRLAGLSCPENYVLDGVLQNAAVLPPLDAVAPVGAVDMNCCFYGNLAALSKMASLLGLADEARRWRISAAAHKKIIFEKLLDEEDAFFYDIDKNGNKRKIKSCTVFHPFMEKLLDPEKDASLIDRIYDGHIKNPEEFYTPFPFPAVAANDRAFCKTVPYNCWGYFSQGLVAERATRWMDAYGKGDDLDALCEKWLEAWTDCCDESPFGQELDPFTGKPPVKNVKWYSATVLFYLYAAKRLGIAA